MFKRIQARVAIITFAIFVLITACSERPEYIVLENGFSTEVDVISLKYKQGIDSASTAKASLRSFHVDVIHTDDTFYTIWQEQIRSIANSDSGLNELELMMQSPNYVNGVRAEYTLLEDGFLGDLSNWPEIKAYVDSVSLDYFKQLAPDPNDKQKLEKIMMGYNTKENMENKMFKCVSIFHAPYGLYIDTSDAGRQWSFNPALEIEPVDEQLLWFHKYNDRLFFLCAYPEVRTDVGPSLLEPFGDMGIPDSILNLFNQIHFVDTLYCDFNLDKCSLNTATHTRTMRILEDTYVEIIELQVH